MQIQKRQSRAKARAKTNRLTRRGVPFTHSKWHYLSTWRYPGTPGEWLSMRKTHTWAKTRAFVRSQVRDSAA